MMLVEIPKLWAIAVIEAVVYSFLLLWMGAKVVGARRKYGVKLPTTFENKDDSAYNRYQRAHLNAVENAPTFYATLLLSALSSPIFSAVAGALYIIGRYVYCMGYYESVSARHRGQFYCMYCNHQPLRCICVLCLFLFLSC